MVGKWNFPQREVINSNSMVITAISIILFIFLISVISHFYYLKKKFQTERVLKKSLNKSNLTIQDIREDIAHYRDFLLRVHPLQIEEFPLKDIDPYLQKLEEKVNHSMSRLEFYNYLAPVIGLTGDEHTAIQMPDKELRQHHLKGGKFFPYKIRLIDTRYIIDEDPFKGDELVSVNNIQINELMKTLSFYFSGTSDVQKIFFTVRSFREAFFFAYGQKDKFQITVKKCFSEILENYEVQGIAVTEIIPKTRDVVINESPVVFCNSNYFALISDKTMLFTFNTFQDNDGKLSEQLKNMFLKMHNSGVKNLIIDLRNNSGGNTLLADKFLNYIINEPYRTMISSTVKISPELKDKFISYIPEFIRWFPLVYLHPWTRPLWKGKDGDQVTIKFRYNKPKKNKLHFKGNIYLLAGPGSYSSTSIFLAALKRYKLGKIIGEPTGGFPTLYGNNIEYHLPNSGLLVLVPSGIVRGYGTGPVQPDYKVKQTLKDLRENRDTVYEFAHKLIETT